MINQRLAHPLQQGVKLLAPAGGIRGLELNRGGNAVEHRREQPVAAGHVHVERGGSGVQGARDPTHGDRLKAV